jgi:hypothetical protein
MLWTGCVITVDTRTCILDTYSNKFILLGWWQQMLEHSRWHRVQPVENPKRWSESSCARLKIFEINPRMILSGCCRRDIYPAWLHSKACSVGLENYKGNIITAHSSDNDTSYNSILNMMPTLCLHSQVGDVCTRRKHEYFDLISVQLSEPIEKCYQMLLNHNVRHLLVVKVNLTTHAWFLAVGFDF